MHFMKNKWNTWIIGKVYVHMMYVYTHDLALLKIKSEL